MSRDICVGVDGCAGGWLAVALSPRTFDVQRLPYFAALWERYDDSKLILVDIPVGMRDRDPVERLCDLAARKALGRPRASSVFPVPCREAAYSGGDSASTLNFKLTGRRHLSVQTLCILPKIRQVDTFLRNHGDARSRVRETHPELCFWALNGGKAMVDPKKSEQGLEERIELLRSIRADARDIFEHARTKYPRKLVEKDDIVDALACAVTAMMCREKASILPANPEIDSKGLPMEIVYHLRSSSA